MRSTLALADVASFGAVAGLTRLAGGTVKGVYRLAFADGHTALVYRWHPDENYWPARVTIDVPPFGNPGGPDVFLRRHALLTSLGVRVPRLLAVHGSLALVEDVPGGTLEALLASPAAATPVPGAAAAPLSTGAASPAADASLPAGATGPLSAGATVPLSAGAASSAAAAVSRGAVALDQLRVMLRRMHSHRVPAEVDAPGAALERGRRALAEAAARVPRIAAAASPLASALESRHAAITPVHEHGIIHGELGPDHVLIDASGEPVLIDIEGTMAFDVEWEHAFLELRFGDDYRHLSTVPLDPARMELYRLVHYLSLVAGPLQLLDGDFPDPEGMRQIAEWNVERVLASI